jgi:methylphosphotriester-DNA--protein-cysteine methyltransferase
MTYNHHQLYLRVDEMLSSFPRCPLHALEQALNVHRHTVEHVVLASTGMTFRRYRTDKLVGRCLSLLNQGLSAKEIMLQMGFSHAASLSRFIRHATGLAPTSLRNTEKRPAG